MSQNDEGSTTGVHRNPDVDRIRISWLMTFSGERRGRLACRLATPYKTGGRTRGGPDTTNNANFAQLNGTGPVFAISSLLGERTREPEFTNLCRLCVGGEGGGLCPCGIDWTRAPRDSVNTHDGSRGASPPHFTLNRPQHPRPNLTVSHFLYYKVELTPRRCNDRCRRFRFPFARLSDKSNRVSLIRR
ncbi:hypothetical protein J6590_029487 [Homalodisca vitripennis]|nr:hypothetical protein J6590_029487 [Homalodisca vitripennis]